MKILVNDGLIEPDEGPRDTRWHKRIVRTEKVEGYRAAYNLMLECGHGVQAFGNLAHAEGVVLCTKCRDQEAS